MNHTLLGCLLMIAVSQALQDAEHDWWYWAIDGSLQEIEAQWPEAAESFAKATEQNPDWSFGWFLLGRAAVEAGDDETAEWALEQVAEDPDIAAHAWFQRARLAARGDDEEAAEQCLAAALELQMYVPVRTLTKDPHFRRQRQKKWWRAFKSAMREPQERYAALADAGDDAGLQALFRSLDLLWIDEDQAPAALVRETLDEIVGLRRKGDTDSQRLGELTLRAQRGAEAGDVVYGNQVWSAWVAAIVELDPAACESYADYWKAIDGTTKMFRGHRFKQLMQRFVPAEAAAEKIGDAAGILEIKCVLGLTRECLVEYKVRGHDRATAWRAGWEDYVEVRARALQLGDREYVVDAYENRFEFFGHLPDERIRDEFYTAQLVGTSLVEMALHGLRLPAEDRRIDDYRNWMQTFGVYP